MNQKKVLKIENKINAEIFLPGSKSITLRDFVLASLANGESEILRPAECDDADRMIEALKELGIKIEKISGGLKIFGQVGKFASGEKKLYLGGSGVSTRLLLAVAALRKQKTVIDGNESLRARPNKYLIDSLKELGAEIKSRNGFLPLEIIGRENLKSKIKMKGDLSSQYFTALLQIAPVLSKGLKIEVEGNLTSKPYIDITVNEMKKFGAVVENSNYRSFFVQSQKYKPAKIIVEGDASAASYFMALAAIHGGKIILKNLGKNSVQGDFKFYKVCEKLGAKVELSDSEIKITGSRNGKLDSLKEINMEDIPDTATTLMAIAPFIPGKTLITGIANLKLKECDRISAPVAELKKLGVKVREGKDFIEIDEKKDFSDVDLSKISIDTYDDHRMAMSFAILGTKIGNLKINDPSCVNKTFPSFWEILEQK
ncbi:3-phosphoshikimate 1-carboxyvinyltransferase, partial [Candidatus Parcubacteria bacterium]|nr:3-phosphoshikimate 1-carboxyvinyltransferase [Candidatus Parcubacteria bacterium]